MIDRCEQAIKLIRAKENKVPVMKFQFNRTSMVVSNSNDLAANAMNKSPLQAHSIFNATFKLNAPPNTPVKNPGLKMLPRRVKDVAQSLGINSVFLFEKMRTKELNAQITNNLKRSRTVDDDASKGEILIQTTTVSSVVETAEIGTQTANFKCEQCNDRRKRTMVNEHSQTFIRGVSIGVQTNEKDYREPIVELLSRMTAAQLVAIKDFANIVDEPRPRSTEEMYKMRERLMDVYSLSQRDADAVRAAEDNRMDETLFDQHRYRGRGDGMYGDGPSRDLDRRSNSPRWSSNGVPRDGDRGSLGRGFEPNDFGNDRSSSSSNIMDDRQRLLLDDQFNRRQQQFSRDEEEEIERQRYIQLERQRELELELNQRRYDEQMELERNAARLSMHGNVQQRQKQLEDELRLREQEEREREMRNSMFNIGRGGSGGAGGGGAINRRGRGAFRGTNRGGRR